MNDFDLKEIRNNLVAKNNQMIQKSRMSLDLLENKAILYLISKIRPDDEPGKIYVFNCREFQSLVNWNREASYQNVKIMLQNLGDLSWWIEREVNGKRKDILVRWFNIVHMDPGTGDIEISFHEDMFPFLLTLNKGRMERYFTTYRLQNVTLMKHRYSPRIYELLKSYQYNNKRWTFENGTGTELDLQRRIADTVIDKKTREAISLIPGSWSNWAVFRRDVLEPAVKEINKYTDIKVAYEGKKEDMHHRKTRGVRSIEFYMAGKTTPEQRETDTIIDSEYTVIGEEQECQPSMEQVFFEDHERKLEEERKERELFAAQKKEQQIDNAKHQVLFAELNGERNADFDEKKVNQLYQAAIRNRVAGIVPITQWELFATDLVIYYYDKITALSEETTTTQYKRLYDCVLRDYDDQVFELLKLYGE